MRVMEHQQDHLHTTVNQDLHINQHHLQRSIRMALVVGLRLGMVGLLLLGLPLGINYLPRLPTSPRSRRQA